MHPATSSHGEAFALRTGQPRNITPEFRYNCSLLREPRMTAHWRDYDTAHREIFAHPQVIEDLLRHFVHGSWVQELDYGTLRRETEISVTYRSGLKVRDIVWSI